MKEITLNSWITFAFAFGILIMLLCIIVFYIKEWGIRQLKIDRSNEIKYKLMYLEIQKHMEEYHVDPGMYYKIKDEIRRLENLEWQDIEKTAVLRAELCTGRFLNIALSEGKKRIENIN